MNENETSQNSEVVASFGYFDQLTEANQLLAQALNNLECKTQEQNHLIYMIGNYLDGVEACSQKHLSPMVIKLALGMQYKLDKNKRKEGWPLDKDGQRKAAPFSFLLKKLDEELGELKDAVVCFLEAATENKSAAELGDLKIKLFLEASDLSNIAGLIVDKSEAVCRE